MEAIILAGGFGTRLKEVVTNLPKSMALINGRPFLEYLLDFLKAEGVNHFVLSVGYKREAIMDHFGDKYRDVRIDYSVEEEPLGTGGGIRLALWKIDGIHAFAMNGDSLLRVDLNQMMEAHLRKKADITIALRELQETGRYGLVRMNRNCRIVDFSEKQQDAGEGYINGGVYIIEKKFLMEPDFRGNFSIEKDCFEQYYETSKMYGFRSGGYFLDIGTPETFKQAQDDFKRFND
ncbi:MAG: NTP transferase domain-containing protein [Bacteroidia bacterium]|nr:NTP transferase domain-containing protein [Bacteroidia bacterium]